MTPFDRAYVQKVAKAYGGTGAPAGSVAWADITDKPSTFNPASHGNEKHSSTFITAADIPASLPPTAHASTHISTGGDAIADAVSSGASGLMSGADKAKLDALQGQIQADWNQASNLEVDYIKNKPSIPTQYTDEMAQDASASMIAAGTHTAVSFTYDDANNKMSGAVQFGSTGTTACVGNDARLSDARTPTTHQHSALRQTLTQASHGFAAGDCLYRTSGAYAKAKADVEATAELYGIVESVNGDDFVVVLPGGIISGLTGGTDGAVGFLSAATAGAITTTDPSIADPTLIRKPIIFYTSTTGGQVLGMPGFVQSEEIALGMADVRLVRTDTNTTTLSGMPGTGKIIEVNGEAVDLSSDKTIDTDSASHFVITGTTSVSKSTALDSYAGAGSDGNNYNAYGLHHVYVCNSNACWNFASYDRRGSIILSPSAPTADGYLAASDHGANARHVGWVIVGSSRTMETVLCLVSRYNRTPGTYKLQDGADWDALTSGDGYADIPDSACQLRCIIPPDTATELFGHAEFWNDDVDNADLGARITYDNTGSTQAATAFENIRLDAGYRRGAAIEPRLLFSQEDASVHLIKLQSYIGNSPGSSAFLYTATCWILVAYGGVV